MDIRNPALRAVVAAGLCCSLGGCMTAAAAAIAYESNFQPADFAWAEGSGPAVLQGRLHADESTGRVGSCAGQPVVLMPYGRALRLGANAQPEFRNGPPAFREEARRWRRETVCDADGRFTFSDLPMGHYALWTSFPSTKGHAFIEPYVVGQVRITARSNKLDWRVSCRRSATDRTCFVR